VLLAAKLAAKRTDTARQKTVSSAPFSPSASTAFSAVTFDALTSALVQISWGLMSVKEFPYSVFLRGPSEVLPALEHGDVQLERRDGEDLVLTRRQRYQAAMEGVSLVSRMLRSMAKDDPEKVGGFLAEQLPWVRWLPKGELADCLAEILSQLAAGAETGTFEPFSRAVTQWAHTAEVWADPELAKRLTSPFAGDGPEILRPKAR
jgi:hypothetical protein